MPKRNDEDLVRVHDMLEAAIVTVEQSIRVCSDSLAVYVKCHESDNL